MVEIDSKSLSVAFFLIFGLIAFWSVITQETQWGRIYTNVFYLSTFLILLSYILPHVFDYQPVSDKDLGYQIVAGLLLGFALVGGFFLQGFTLLAPLSIPDVSGILGLLGFSVISQVFIMSIVISEFEETLRSGTLRPSIAKWLEYPQGVTAVLLIFGVIIYFLIEPFRVLGLGLVVLGIINFLQKGVLARYIEGKWARFFIAIMIAGAFFSLLHLTAYASPEDPSLAYGLMLNAFLYAVMADFINTYFESTIPSRVAHTFNNATVSAFAVGIPLPFAFLVTGAHALIMYVIARGQLPGG